MADIEFDKRDQLKRIQAYLVPGEQLFAVYDMKGGGTGFVGITDLRLIFYDQAFLRKKKAMVSIPFTQITSIASEDTGKLLMGTLLGSSNLIITTTAGETQEFTFRSNDKAHRAYKLMVSQMLQSEVPG